MPGHSVTASSFSVSIIAGDNNPSNPRPRGFEVRFPDGELDSVRRSRIQTTAMAVLSGYRVSTAWHRSGVLSRSYNRLEITLHETVEPEDGKELRSTLTEAVRSALGR